MINDTEDVHQASRPFDDEKHIELGERPTGDRRRETTRP
jgi:hypothetical protein